jgi:alkylhydroperoxidase family enzyme
MFAFPIHTIESAPNASRPALETLQNAFGLIPNLAATMASSPTLIDAFVAAVGAFSNGTFTGGERQILLLTNAVANRSSWAVAFHSTAALREGIDTNDVKTIRDGRAPSDEKLAALSTMTKECIENRGRVSEAVARAFVAAGYTGEQLLEVLAGVAVSAMANYAGNITKPPVESPFASQAWQGA